MRSAAALLGLFVGYYVAEYVTSRRTDAHHSERERVLREAFKKR